MGDTHPAALSNHTSTQQHAAAKPRFIITGFGHFCGVAQNPTEQLVNWLQSQGCATQPSGQQHDSNNQQHYCISSLDVLEVSADAVDAFMQKQRELLVKDAASHATGQGPQPVVLLHFGVDTQRPAISLELQAYNDATFTCPDQAGWQPKACLIEAAPGLGTSSVRTTCLPLQELVHQLRDAGFECGVSRDAGRFVCNYTYYRSLQMTSKLQQQLVWPKHQQQQQQQQEAACGASPASAVAATAANGNGSAPLGAGSDTCVAASQTVEQRRAAALSAEHGWPCFSLFVHMPSFEVVNQARQREFVLHLLDLVAKCVAGSGGHHHQQQVQEVQQQVQQVFATT